MPASALGHGAFPFWDASFVRQYWASVELCQAQLCRDFFFKMCVCLFFKNNDLIKWSHCHLGAGPLALWTRSPRATQCCRSDPASWPCCRSRVLLTALPARSCFRKGPLLQGDKAFLSACPSLLPSGDFVECRSCYGAVCIPVSVGAGGKERCPAHEILPSHLNGGVKTHPSPDG